MPLDLHFFGGQLLALQLETATNETTGYYPNRRRHACERCLGGVTDGRDGKQRRIHAQVTMMTASDGFCLSAPIQFNFETQWTAVDNPVIMNL